MPRRIKIIQGDITTMKVEAIVNAANSSLLGGGGVDGAIHKAAGPGLLQECQALNGCATGDAKVTGGYDLYARHVIHTVGPKWQGGKAGEAKLLASCYRSCLKLAAKIGVKTVAFPAISTGVYGYPIEEAAPIALEACMDFLKRNSYLDDVYLVCFDQESVQTFQEALKKLKSAEEDPAIFHKDAIDSILSDLKDLDDFNHVDFSDIDLKKIDRILSEGPASRYLPKPLENYKSKLPPVNEKGELEYPSDEGNLIVPAVYVPLVEFCFHRFGSEEGWVELPGKNIFELIWNYIQQVVVWAFSLNKTLYGQIYDILKEVDSYLETMKDDLLQLEARYANDPLYKELENLPDLFVYVCRLLENKGVPNTYKAELVLAFIYLISPIDFIPEGIIAHPIAFCDDMALILYLVKRGMDEGYVNEKIMHRLWPGPEDFISNLNEHYQRMEDHLGKEFIDSIWDYLSAKLK